MVIPLSDETTALETGKDVVTFVSPRAFRVVGMAIGLSKYGGGTVGVSVVINGTTRTVSIGSGSESTFKEAAAWSILTLAKGNSIKCEITQSGVENLGLKLYLLGDLLI